MYGSSSFRLPTVLNNDSEITMKPWVVHQFINDLRSEDGNTNNLFSEGTGFGRGIGLAGDGSGTYASDGAGDGSGNGIGFGTYFSDGGICTIARHGRINETVGRPSF